MVKYNLNDTIAAIATAIGESGIGIVRLSGKDACSIADKVFVSKDGTKPSGFKTYTMHYGWIISSRRPQAAGRRLEIKNMQHEACSLKQEIIDEVILTIMRAPKSFTKEDVVEINCHGGIVALRRVLELVLEKGARLAEPGEFTKRAFLNGRIDLAQAEAVLDIIRAKTDAALKIGMQQLKGALSTQLNKIREELLDILVVLEANIDFPEEEIGAADLKKVMNRLNSADKELRQILDSSERGKILREGINVVICGKPNVGKSSLLNTLLKTERSIVSHIPGTTRDTIEEIIDIKGIPIKIVDTAGIIEPKDLVERKAIQRARKYIDSADLVILLFDASKKLSKEDNLLMQRVKNKPVVAAINKIDLRQRIEKAKIRKRFLRVIDISAKKAQNINCLEEAILDLVSRGKADTQPELMLLSNARHIEAIKEAQKLIVQAIDLLDNGVSIEFIAQDLKDALSNLDNILGKTFSEDLLDNIFSQFCIGK